jgi:hypothetical protein
MKLRGFLGEYTPCSLESDVLIIISVLQVSSMKKYHASYCRLV